MCLEHEAGIVGVGRDAAEGIFGSREVEIFFGADRELHVLVHVVVVIATSFGVGVVGCHILLLCCLVMLIQYPLSRDLLASGCLTI